MEIQAVVLDSVGAEKNCTVNFQAPVSLRVEALKVCRLTDVTLAAVLRMPCERLLLGMNIFNKKKGNSTFVELPRFTFIEG